ncbi:MAG: HAD hydrolase-like protein, partial [Planctomycetes bacterium]|nr:HAD hydrolase-like protein [Planctomycetota bacterium]
VEMQPKPLSVAFFDIGGTLGTVSLAPLELKLFPTTISWLQNFRDILGMRLGVISNIGDLQPANITALLQSAGLLKFLSADLIITSRDGHGQKPESAIYQFAAIKAALPINQCLYIGEDPVEVQAAIKTGMSGIVRRPAG